ncbi:MAG TPA: type VI secretion system tube protein TssD [Ignavibacteriales bacterium]|jgi:type VI secretion system secreted protein Hcp|nr:type VI secretion system tube protein TssD [Ignavibacteriales bacterium]
MAVKGEILFKNNEGTELKGPRENKTSLVYEFKHEVYLPFETEENKIQGSRKITAFEIVKGIDELTPQLYQIVSKGQMCKEIVITLYRIAEETGDEEPYFNYTLKQAKVVSVKDWMPATFDGRNEDVGHLETVKMLAREFNWKYLDGGIEYSEKAF